MRQAKRFLTSGTSFHGVTIEATVQELRKVLGEPFAEPNNSTDKVNFEWCMINGNDVFTVYDWKEYRVLPENEVIEWHIGAADKQKAINAKLELEQLLSGNQEQPKTTTHPTKKLTPDTSSIFVKPIITIQINTALVIVAEVQVICCLGKDDWIYDVIEISGIKEIHYSGFVIRDLDKVSAFTKYHREIGIDIWQAADDEADRMVREYPVHEFIELFTPLKLRK